MTNVKWPGFTFPATKWITHYNSEFKDSFNFCLFFIFRALLSIGHCFITIWGGVEICALDILLWNCLIVFLNVTHTAILTWRFLPPTLSLEMTDLYLKVSSFLLTMFILLLTGLFCVMDWKNLFLYLVSMSRI